MGWPDAFALVGFIWALVYLFKIIASGGISEKTIRKLIEKGYDFEIEKDKE
jgi:hypothetical protein